MRKTALALACATACALAGRASAEQFHASADINTGSASAAAYFGTGYSGSKLGDVFDGGRDAFDNYGIYTGDFGGLSLFRQTELFADQNLFRFFDTFVNPTGAAVTATVMFGGNLGSDGATQLLESGGGLYVTCFGSGGHCSGDPVIAHVGGAAALQSLSVDNYAATFQLSVDPGQSVSLLNFAFLASNLSGTNASDIDVAIAKGQSLLADPFLDGLTETQRAQIVNFTANPTIPAGVPEPETWALMIAGFAGAGATLRARRRRLA